MRDVTVTVTMKVEDDVTDDMLQGWLAELSPHVEEPVYHRDPMGNEREFDSSEQTMKLDVDGRELVHERF